MVLVSAETGKKIFDTPDHLQVGWAVGPRLIAIQRGPEEKKKGSAKMKAFENSGETRDVPEIASR